MYEEQQHKLPYNLLNTSLNVTSCRIMCLARRFDP